MKKILSKIKKGRIILSHIEIKYDPKQLVISICLLFGLIVFCYGIILQMIYVNNLYHDLYGKSDEEIRELLFRDYYLSVNNIKEHIPETDNILSIRHYRNSNYYFVNYYLYPRKIYSYQNPYVSWENISTEWLDERDIKWIVLYNKTNSNLNDYEIIKIR